MAKRNFSKKTGLFLLCMLIAIGGVAASIFFAAQTPKGARAKNLPNIVVLIADDLSANDISAYASDTIATPNIDWLAENGLLFKNAFLTTSSCSPSRGSIMTGKFPTQNGLRNLHEALPANQKTLGQLLREAGYYTAAAGKWHLGSAAAPQFDLIYAERNSGDSGSEKWLRLFDDRPSEKPFFFWLAAIDPHRPFSSSGEDLPPPVNPKNVRIPRLLVDTPNVRQLLASYYREVLRFDKYVGLVTEKLKKDGLLGNTIVIVMADNGRPFALSKTTLYDSGLRTPFIVHWPYKISGGQVTEALVSAIDIAPTFLEAASAPQPGDMSGLSFFKLFSNPAQEHRTEIFGEQNWHGRDDHHRAIRTKNFFYQENQFPPYGLCKGHALPGLGDLSQVYARGSLPDWYDDCFSENSVRQELYRVDENGDIIFENLITDPSHWETAEILKIKLRDWRLKISDRDFVPYSD